MNAKGTVLKRNVWITVENNEYGFTEKGEESAKPFKLDIVTYDPDFLTNSVVVDGPIPIEIEVKNDQDLAELLAKNLENVITKKQEEHLKEVMKIKEKIQSLRALPAPEVIRNAKIPF